MTTVLSPADVSANVGSVPGGRATKIKGQIVHVAPAAQLLDVQAVAEMLGCSQRHVYRLSDAGRMPSPVKLGSLVRWSAAAIREWIDQGCPSIRQVKGAGR
jgi:excisionase family DNA binding protein